MGEKDSYYWIAFLNQHADMANEKFDADVKRAIREEQDNLCGSCGHEVRQLLIHHILPIQLGGSKNIENAVGLCIRCHQYWDELALQEHTFFRNR